MHEKLKPGNIAYSVQHIPPLLRYLTDGSLPTEDPSVGREYQEAVVQYGEYMKTFLEDPRFVD